MNNRFKFRVWNKELKEFVVGKIDFKFTESLGYEYDYLIIQQWTGLKDKNNKEIYEGDIIKFMGKWDDKGNVLEPDYRPYEVVWFMSGLYAKIRKRSCRSYHIHNEVLGVGHIDCEIIGNIFENSELGKNE